jgi:outer membrane protein assembly factor BamB
MRGRLAFSIMLLVTFFAPSLSFAQKNVSRGNWPQWRGLKRDGISDDKGLVRKWGEAGPKVVWSVDTVGVGYSSLAVKDGRIITQGDLEGVEHIICLSEKDGKLLWAVQPEPVKKVLAERLEQEMKRADTDGDGQLNESEALARFGWNFNRFDKETDGDAEKMAATRVTGLFAVLDKNSDKNLDASEAARSFGNEFGRIDATDANADAAQLAKSRTTAFLKSLDKDGDARVSRQESRGSALDRIFNRADQRDPKTRKGDQQLTVDEMETYFTKFERGKDGLITQDELRSYYTQRLPKRDGVITKAELRVSLGGYRNGQGDGPRGTPVIDGDRVYVEGGNGDLTCLDAATGKTVWHLNLSADFGGGRPGWGYSESPLIVDDKLIVTPGGGKGTVTALDKSNGKVVWRSEGVKQRAHYASPVVAEIGGVKQIVQFARGSVFGVTLDGGKLLWEYSNANNGTANAATPIIYKDHVFASSGYGTGGGLAKIVADGDGFKTEEVYFNKSMANHHGGIVKFGDHMYGFGSGGLICMNYLTGEMAWRARSVGKGSLVAADGMLFLLGERYEVGLAEATPEGYEELGRFKIESHGRPSWAHPVVTGGRFYIRNQHSLTSYDVSGAGEE